MKKLCYVLILAALFGCQNRFIEFDGEVPGLASGVIVIKNLNDSTLYGENIKDGKFHLKQLMEYTGYHKLVLANNDPKAEKHPPFEIYIEPGTYTIQAEADKLYKYPKITSSSKTQQELSAFYTINDSLGTDILKEYARANAALSDKNAKFKSKDEYVGLITTLSEVEAKKRGLQVMAFQEFVKRYPESKIAAHLMAKLPYEDDPAAYAKIYSTLTAAAKNSEEGREIGENLSRLTKLLPGAVAPPIAGQTPDGKPFDPAKVKGKFVLVDFWRSGNMASRQYHQEMFKLLRNLKNDDFIIVSVSIDNRADWWAAALKDDKMTWTQLSDLKGDDSPNVANWAIQKVPTYYLLDRNWRIVERDAHISRITFMVQGK